MTTQLPRPVQFEIGPLAMVSTHIIARTHLAQMATAICDGISVEYYGHQTLVYVGVPAEEHETFFALLEEKCGKMPGWTELIRLYQQAVAELNAEHNT